MKKDSSKNRRGDDDAAAKPQAAKPAILFDLDGTLVDSVYQHVMGWIEAFSEDGVEVQASKIHRYIGISGKLLVRGIFRDMGHAIGNPRIDRLEKLHKKIFNKMLPEIPQLPGAKQLTVELSKLGVSYAIASSGDEKAVNALLENLRLPARVPVITGEHVDRAKPEPDVFLEAAKRLGVPLADCIVVGDSVWDLLAARRAKALGVGLLSGGSGREELQQAGAYRVYENPADLLAHLEDIGIHAD